MSSLKRKQTSPKKLKQMKKLQVGRTIQLQNQVEDQFLEFLTTPILVPALCKPAILRAAMFSGTGIDFRKYVSSKIYAYTAYRLEKMFNKLDQYPDSVIKAWVTNKPGFLLYSKSYVGLENVKVYKEGMSPTQIQQYISQGYIVKIEEELPLPEFEAYVNKGGFENEWINSLPIYIDNDHKTGQVLPIFRSDIRKFVLGSMRRTFGLPVWYVSLENRLEGVQIDLPGKMGPGEITFSQFRCTPITPIKTSPAYKPWNDKMRTVMRNKYCLIWDGAQIGVDNQLISNFNKHNLYTVTISGFHVVEVFINGMILKLKVKTKTLVSDNRKRKIIHTGILTEEPDDFFFKLLFSSEDLSEPDSWTPNGLKTGDKYTIRYSGMATGFECSDLLLVNESFNSIVLQGKKRMYVIGRKGTMKTRFTKYAYSVIQDNNVKFIDSDAYGKWVLWMKNGQKESDFYDIDDLTVGTKFNYIEQLADVLFNDVRKGPKYDHQRMEVFNAAYCSLLKDPIVGIRQWQLFVEAQVTQTVIVYFVHSDVEVREMIAANPTPVLVTTYNPLRVLKNRDLGTTRQSQMLLGMYYDKFIPDIVTSVEYKDLLMMCNVDVSVDSY